MRKILKEEKEFRDWIYTTLGGPDKLVSRRITALVRAVREDCIETYYDWEYRPRECAGITYPDAVRRNKRWRKTAAIRDRK